MNGTALYAYDEAGHLLGEYDATDALIEETVWLDDIPVATLRPSGSTVSISYVHSDQLNTPRQVTRPSDNTTMWTWNSDPFGTDAANPNPAGAGTFAYDLRFPGQVFDGQAGLHENYFRDFDPAMGRYIESDPVGLLAGVNTYAYVSGSPVSLLDPAGLADVNLFNPNANSHDSTGTYAGWNAWNIPGVYTVAGHGNQGWMEDVRAGYNRLYPEDLAKLIQKDPNWKNRPVMFGGCHTGDSWAEGCAVKSRLDTFAQMLANLLGVPVTASPQFTRWDSQRGLLGTSPGISEPVQYPGAWKTYYPTK